MDYKDKSKAKYYFRELKRVWDRENILIIEGQQSRLGVGNGLFNNANHVKRIECPSVNAFGSVNKIFRYVKKFLDNHNNYLTLLALGPTATILSYLICQSGHRAIDIGHVDIEYEWYLMHVHKKVDIKNRYVNEVRFGKSATTKIHDKKYYNQIIKIIN